MDEKRLGVLTKVDLREIWSNESTEFTPWLANENNLKLLGESLAMDLEYEAQEKYVGLFRADILCKDIASDKWVLIENQLERTDHSHLGQILTYAAGLEATSVIWIAEKFTEEHRAALDWLNEVTNESIHFFGVEIEVWKIGDSDKAPKFNIVCKPNDWVKSVGSIVKTEVSPTKQLQFEFWTAFKKYLDDSNSKMRTQKPLPQHWMNFAAGRSGFRYYTFANTRDLKIGIVISIETPTAKEHYRELFEQKESIENEIKYSLEWFELPEKKSSVIGYDIHNCDISNKDDWGRQMKLLKDGLEAVNLAFSRRIKVLSFLSNE